MSRVLLEFQDQIFELEKHPSSFKNLVEIVEDRINDLPMVYQLYVNDQEDEITIASEQDLDSNSNSLIFLIYHFINQVQYFIQENSTTKKDFIIHVRETEIGNSSVYILKTKLKREDSSAILNQSFLDQQKRVQQLKAQMEQKKLQKQLAEEEEKKKKAEEEAKAKSEEVKKVAEKKLQREKELEMKKAQAEADEKKKSKQKLEADQQQLKQKQQQVQEQFNESIFNKPEQALSLQQITDHYSNLLTRFEDNYKKQQPEHRSTQQAIFKTNYGKIVSRLQQKLLSHFDDLLLQTEENLNKQKYEEKVKREAEQKKQKVQLEQEQKQAKLKEAQEKSEKQVREDQIKKAQEAEQRKRQDEERARIEKELKEKEIMKKQQLEAELAAQQQQQKQGEQKPQNPYPQLNESKEVLEKASQLADIFCKDYTTFIPIVKKYPTLTFEELTLKLLEN